MVGYRHKILFNICVGTSGEKLPPKWSDVISKAEFNVDFILKNDEIEVPGKLNEVMGKLGLTRLELVGVSRILSKIRKEGGSGVDITRGNVSSYSFALEAIRYFNGGLKKTSKSVKSSINEIGELILIYSLPFYSFCFTHFITTQNNLIYF